MLRPAPCRPRYDKVHATVMTALSGVEDKINERMPEGGPGPTEPEILETRDGMAAAQADDAGQAQQQADGRQKQVDQQPHGQQPRQAAPPHHSQQSQAHEQLDRGLAHWLLGGILYVHVIRATDLRTRPPWKFTMGTLTWGPCPLQPAARQSPALRAGCTCARPLLFLTGLGLASSAGPQAGRAMWSGRRLAERLWWCRQVNVSVGSLTRSTAAIKGASPEYEETLEFFFVAPQLEDEDTAISFEVRDISFLDDVKVRGSTSRAALL